MKINSINGNINTSKSYLNKKLETNINKRDELKNISQPYVNILYYQSYNTSFGKRNDNIISLGESFSNYYICRSEKGIESVISRIQISPETTYNLKISKDVIQKYLSKDGDLDESLLKEFISTYTNVLKKELETDKEASEFISDIFSLENQNKGLNPFDDMGKFIMSAFSKGKEDLVKAVFKKMDTYAAQYSTGRNAQTNIIQQNSYRKTCIVFDLSATNDGYDFSNSDKKIKLAENIINITDKYNGKNLASDYISEIKSDSGSIDFEFAEYLYDFIMKTGIYSEDNVIHNRAMLLHSLSDIDSENKDNVLSSAVLYSSIFGIADSDDYFKQAFMYSVNPITSKFDEKAFKALVGATDEINLRLSDVYIEPRETYEEIRLNAIKGYFDLIRDQHTGCIKENYISYDDYFEEFSMFDT